jgi:hypothetical protein
MTTADDVTWCKKKWPLLVPLLSLLHWFAVVSFAAVMISIIVIIILIQMCFYSIDIDNCDFWRCCLMRFLCATIADIATTTITGVLQLNAICMAEETGGTFKMEIFDLTN